MAFGILICCFAQKPYYFLCFFPPFLDFQRELAFFYLTLIHVFGNFLGLGSLECPKVPLVRQQASLPISRGGVGLVSIEVIVLATYLGIFVGRLSIFVGGYKDQQFRSTSIPGSP